ncbi:MAG: DUF6505 family protein [Pseudomonadota bacterium]
MKFLRTIRFDPSDLQVYEHAAPVDEWAISGAGAFAALADDQIVGKVKQAFANGFTGVPSFAHSTFASVADMSDDARNQIEDALVARFQQHYGAPDEATARAAACAEMEEIFSLCDAALINTVFTVRRWFDADGEMREAFRTIQPPGDGPLHARVWAVVEDDAELEAGNVTGAKGRA